MTAAPRPRIRLSRGVIPNLLLPATALLVVAFILFSRQPDDAAASSYGHGDCWRPRTVWACPYNYTQPGTAYTWFVSRYFSSTAAAYLEPAATGAMSVWTDAVGPQYFLNAPPANVPWTNVYVYEFPYYADPAAWLPSRPGIAAVTWNRSYPDNSICMDLDKACREWYATVFLNNTNNVWATLPALQRQSHIAHELGHVALLGHHPNVAALMNTDRNRLAVYAPTTLDIGSSPPCNEDPDAELSTAGDDLVTIRCI